MPNRKEGVVLNLDDAPSVQPYRDYFEQRNGKIAQDLAGFMGLPYLGIQTGHRGDFYVVPAKTVETESAEKMGITSVDDLYGAVAKTRIHTGKTILHQSASESSPAFYSPKFAQAVEGLVLPGFSGFNREDILAVYNLQRNRSYGFRLKVANESDGLGQFPIADQADLATKLDHLEPSSLHEEGVVLEADVYNPQTISIGFAKIGDQTISFIAQQKNDVTLEDGFQRSRYRGAMVMVVNGGLESLVQQNLASEEQEAAQKCALFHQAYVTHFGIVASRLSFDFLSGLDKTGQRLSGITDITGRLGGTCPALMVALNEFRTNPQKTTVHSEVTLNYEPQFLLESEEGAEVYVDHPTLRITARIN